MKKVLAMALSLALIATMAISTTVAYLTSEDSDVNVMTLGNVKIEQHEYERADNVDHAHHASEGDLVPFEQGQPLYPAVPKADDAYEAEQDADKGFHWGDYVTADGAWNGLWDDAKLANVMDKFVFVENTGKSDAYYRTLIALECPEDMTIGYAANGAEIEINVNGNDRFDWDNKVGSITVDGTRYEVLCVTYNKILTPDEISRPSLLQVILTHHATNEDMELLGDTYEILVLSQAVQAAGFDNAQAALNAAFGEANATNAAEWFGDVEIPTYVSEADELADAIANGNSNIIYTGEGTLTISEEVAVNKSVSIDLGSAKLDLTEGSMALTEGADMTITNATIVADGDKSAFVVKDADSKLTLGSGTVIENVTDAPSAGLINLYRGKVELDGAEITGNSNSDKGHLIDVGSGCELIISEGTVISGNILSENNDNSSLIHVAPDAKVTMKGGKITGNNLGKNYLILIDSNGQFIMEDGEISNNTGSSNMIYMPMLAEFTMNDGSIINNTVGYGFGCGMRDVIAINGGEISGNTWTALANNLSYVTIDENANVQAN